MNDLSLRAPTATEIPRVRHLFRQVALPANAQILVAVRRQPVERFVGGIAGWNEAGFARFHLACQPGANREAIAALLIAEAATTARAAGMEKLLYAELLTDNDAWSGVLQANGFAILRSERFFRVAAAQAAVRITQLIEKYRNEIPVTWRVTAIRHQPPETVLNLIAPFRLMTPDDVCRFWRPHQAQGFDRDLSCIVFENDRPFGTLLVRRTGDVLSYDIRVVNHANVRLRALANLCLFYHDFTTYDPAAIHWLQFRGGETEHRETANLAFRIGGTEMPARHVFARNL